MAGRNYAPALLSGAEPETRPDAFAYHEPGQMMLRTETHKYLRYPRSEGATEVLYDLEADPDELINIAPTPEGQRLLPEIRARALGRALETARSGRPQPYRF
jgi:arylsulfatase A-like enzyme